ncbi:MAG TPA: DUF6391 domain-containing protein [Levilinea sp.]|nr:DUF6391 domain-containing protein [Levilinea sp.]
MMNQLVKAVSRIRRNHALEHATLQLLGNKYPGKGLIGNSDGRGFWVFGEVSTQTLQEAVDEAVARLKNGEQQLAIHPNCGTNYVISGMLAGTLAWLVMLGARRSLRENLDRLPLVMSLVTMGLILAQPLGPLLQVRFTTDSNIGKLQVVEITRYQRRDIPVHRIKTRH